MKIYIEMNSFQLHINKSFFKTYDNITVEDIYYITLYKNQFCEIIYYKLITLYNANLFYQCILIT